MALWEYDSVLPHPIDEVFSLTVDLESAPRWHSIITAVHALSEPPIDRGSRWRLHVGPMRFILTLIEVQPPRVAAFRGTPFLGMVPNFRILLEPVAGGTRVRYLIDPTLPSVLRPLMTRLIPPYGERDLSRYFREVEQRLAERP